MKTERKSGDIIKNGIRFCSLILAIIMCASCITACSGEENSSKSESSFGSSSSSPDSQNSSSSENSNGSSMDTDTFASHAEQSSKVSSTDYDTSQFDRENFVQSDIPRGDMIKNLSEMKKSNIGFGYYGAFIDKYGFKPDVDAMVRSDYANTFFNSSSNADPYILKFLSDNNSKCWIPVGTIYALAKDNKEGWEEVFDKLANEYQKSGYWDTVLGWYLDEPTDHEVVMKISKYAKEKYNKRFFVCYLACSVAPNYSAIGTMDKIGISERTTAYLTDIAYDLYWNATEQRAIYEYVNKSMHELLGKNNPKIWYIPYLAFWGSVLEASDTVQRQTNLNQIAHLELMYEFLKQEKNPGGLLCYAYDIDDTAYENQYGWKEANQLSNGKFQSLFQRSTTIGREICSGKSGIK